MKRLALAVVLLAAPAWAAEDSGVPDWVKNSKVFGNVFVDAYDMVQNHDATIKDANGFWDRRIMLGVDSKLSEEFSSRFRFEIDPSGDFKTSATLTPFVKDAWIRWRSGPRDVYFGMAETPTWVTVERTWGYRSVEKTPLDLQKMGNSNDMGVGLVGTAAEGKLSYAAMAGNGSASSTENNKGKKVYGAVGYHPSKKWVVEGYADHEARPLHTDRTTVQGFVGYVSDEVRVGGQVVHQTRQVLGANDQKINVASVFGVVKLRERISFLARFDRLFEPNPDGPKISYLPFSADAKSSLLIAGVDFKLFKTVSLIPNFEFVHYDGAVALDNDLMLRVTAAWSF